VSATILLAPKAFPSDEILSDCAEIHADDILQDAYRGRKSSRMPQIPTSGLDSERVPTRPIILPACVTRSNACGVSCHSTLNIITSNYPNLNKILNLLFTLSCCFSDNCPNSRRIMFVVAVIIRCKRKVDETRKPVRSKSSSSDSINMSVSKRSFGTLLVINAKTTCRY